MFTPFKIVKPEYKENAYFKITKLIGMEEKDLPEEYTERNQYLYYHDERIWIRDKTGDARKIVGVGDLVRPPEFNSIKRVLQLHNIMVKQILNRIEGKIRRIIEEIDTNVKYYYLRDKTHRPIITICVMENEKGKGVGVSICSPKDNPDKKKGRKIAKQRALYILQGNITNELSIHREEAQNQINKVLRTPVSSQTYLTITNENLLNKIIGRRSLTHKSMYFA